MKKDSKKINYLEKDVKFTKQEWIELLEWAFKNDGLKFTTQNIIDINDDSILMQEYFTRLNDSNGNIYYPGDFWSIVYGMGWMVELEKHIISKIFKTNLTNNKINSAINLSSEFTQPKETIKWLILELNKFDSAGNNFYF
ncbi:MAG: EAL domain-containing protein [Aliarcobacter sp.]|nr:EAL domain-containing protein [Aliarcobacter sp.]